MNIKYNNFLAIILASGFLSACKPDSNTSSASEVPTVAPVTISEPKVEYVELPTEFSPYATQVADAVQASKARLASEKSEICPKLIEFKVDNKLVVRQDEIMRRQSCKYYLYPDLGTVLDVNIDNGKLQANIVQPEFYDFSAGKYKVTSVGKHVLEISYKDHHGNREPEKYSLEVSNN